MADLRCLKCGGKLQLDEGFTSQDVYACEECTETIGLEDIAGRCAIAETELTALRKTVKKLQEEHDTIKATVLVNKIKKNRQ